jgi:hypothetical protein
MVAMSSDAARDVVKELMVVGEGYGWQKSNEVGKDMVTVLGYVLGFGGNEDEFIFALK